jgi:hypothetical protein
MVHMKLLWRRATLSPQLCCPWQLKEYGAQETVMGGFCFYWPGGESPLLVFNPPPPPPPRGRQAERRGPSELPDISRARYARFCWDEGSRGPRVSETTSQWHTGSRDQRLTRLRKPPARSDARGATGSHLSATTRLDAVEVVWLACGPTASSCLLGPTRDERKIYWAEDLVLGPEPGFTIYFLHFNIYYLNLNLLVSFTNRIRALIKVPTWRNIFFHVYFSL